MAASRLTPLRHSGRCERDQAFHQSMKVGTAATFPANQWPLSPVPHCGTAMIIHVLRGICGTVAGSVLRVRGRTAQSSSVPSLLSGCLPTGVLLHPHTKAPRSPGTPRTHLLARETVARNFNEKPIFLYRSIDEKQFCKSVFSELQFLF
jgi:hypothetical protein